MTRRALLIGSATAGLEGCDNDLARMREVVGDGCKLDVRSGPDATRAGILEAYKSLIQAASDGDAVIVYYSGHGGLVANPDAGKPGEPGFYQCIVPFDWDKSKDDDFRGITSMELSDLLRQLTGKTKNVTVILDCCHSTRMSRNIKARRARALKDPLAIDISKHLAALKKEGASLTSGGLEGNPDAVRLVACGLLESAWEYEGPSGVGGALTNAFHQAIKEAGAMGGGAAKVTWEALGRRVRETVLSQFATQRPDVEGPLTRYLFSIDERQKDGRLGVVQRTNGVFLQGGLVLDVRAGDAYKLYPAADGQPAFASAVVKGVGPSEALLSLDPAGAAIPDGAQAVLVKRTAALAPIAVIASEADRVALVSAVERFPLTKVAAAGDTPLASLTVEGGKLAIRDWAGDLLAVPRAFQEALGLLPANLRAIAVAHSMRKLQSFARAPFPETEYSVTWGIIENGDEKPLDLVGARFKSGDKMFVRLENKGPRTLYFTVFDVGVSQSVSLLSDSLPSGVPIESGGAPYVLGLDSNFILTGWPVDWPATVPVESARHGGDGAREEELVVVIADRQQDLRPAETAGVRGAPAQPGGASAAPRELTEDELDFAQMFSGTTREVRPQALPAAYRVVHIQFLLVPPQAGVAPQH